MGKKQHYVEGWVEFANRRLAKRIATTLNCTPVGGSKRHNFYRDDMWNMRYLPRFKWHQLKEQEIYNRQVRKARLEQKVGQARRENEFYLEKVHQAKVQPKIAEKRDAKGGAARDSEADDRFGGSGRKGSKQEGQRDGDVARGFEISDHLLDSLSCDKHMRHVKA